MTRQEPCSIRRLPPFLQQPTVGPCRLVDDGKVVSFKKDTDDLRESPFVTLAEGLIGTGYDLKVFDKNVSLARLIGSNAAYIRDHMPHIDGVFADRLEDVIAHAEVLVVCNYEDIYAPPRSAV